MDIFHIETASLGTTRTNGAIIDDVTNDQIPQVSCSFDGGPEFNLNFFDSPDDSNTGYSDPGSVDSTPTSPPPPPQPLTTASSTTSTPQTPFTTPTNFPCSIGMFSISLFSGSLQILFQKLATVNTFKAITSNNVNGNFLLIISIDAFGSILKKKKLIQELE